MEGSVDVLAPIDWLRKHTHGSHAHVHTLLLFLLTVPAVQQHFRFRGNFRHILFTTHTHCLVSPSRRSSLLAFSVSHWKCLQPSHHSLYLLLCLNLPRMHLDISASGCISESCRVERERETDIESRRKLLAECGQEWRSNKDDDWEGSLSFTHHAFIQTCKN